jgi:hypothetical protein
MKLLHPSMFASFAAVVVITMFGTRAYIIDQYNKGTMVAAPVSIGSVETADGRRGYDTTVKVTLTHNEPCAPNTTSLQFTDTLGFIFITYAKWTPVLNVTVEQTRTFIIHINRLSATGEVRDVVLAMEDWICDGKRKLLPRLEKSGKSFKVRI